ncbi:MAG: hypothetical protein ABSA46_11795 [Thermodesulfovibrionales bacterium]
MVAVFVTVVAVSFIVAFAYAAVAPENTHTLKGEVVAVDKIAHTFTVKSSDPLSRESDREFTFATDEGTNVNMCTMNKSFRDIGIGEKVTLTYHKEQGELIADAINIDVPTLAFACYDQ